MIEPGYVIASVSACSIIATLSIGIVTLWKSDLHNRQHSTLSMISLRFSNNNIRVGQQLVLNCIAEDRPLDVMAMSDEDLANIQTFLGYLEFLCVGYIQKTIARETLEFQSRSMIVQTFNTCRSYIENRRVELRRKKLYRAMEVVAQRFEKDDKRMDLRGIYSR